MGEARNAATTPADQRYDKAYLSGAICPARGVGAALPYADTDMMQLHLGEISRNVAESADAVLIFGRARWQSVHRPFSAADTSTGLLDVLVGGRPGARLLCRRLAIDFKNGPRPRALEWFGSFSAARQNILQSEQSARRNCKFKV